MGKKNPPPIYTLVHGDIGQALSSKKRRLDQAIDAFRRPRILSDNERFVRFAAVTLAAHSLVDWVWNAHRKHTNLPFKSKEEYLNYIGSNMPIFEYVRDVSNTEKHLFLEYKPSANENTIASAIVSDLWTHSSYLTHHAHPVFERSTGIPVVQKVDGALGRISYAEIVSCIEAFWKVHMHWIK